MSRPYVNSIFAQIEESNEIIKSITNASDAHEVAAAIVRHNEKIGEIAASIQPDSLYPDEIADIRSRVNATIDDLNAASREAYASINPHEVDRLMGEHPVNHI